MLRYQIKQFSWKKINGINTLYAEASNLGLKAEQWPKEFEIENKQTGNIVKFKFKKQVIDKENDLLGINYFGTINGKPLTAILIND